MLRVLVLLLVLANILFFAFTDALVGRAENPDRQRLQQQLNPERIRILGPDATPKPCPNSTEQATPCP